MQAMFPHVGATVLFRAMFSPEMLPASMAEILLGHLVRASPAELPHLRTEMGGPMGSPLVVEMSEAVLEMSMTAVVAVPLTQAEPTHATNANNDGYGTKLAP